VFVSLGVIVNIQLYIVVAEKYFFNFSKYTGYILQTTVELSFKLVVCNFLRIPLTKN